MALPFRQKAMVKILLTADIESHVSFVTSHGSPVTCPLGCLAYYVSYVNQDCIHVEASRGLSG